MAECLTMSGILLISVGKGHIGPLLHVIPRTVTSRDALDERTAVGDVREVKRFAVATISSRGQCMLPGSTEEVEGDNAEVKNCLGSVLIVIEGETRCQGMGDGDVDGPDPSRSQVCIGPCL
jgi:hypothetical protein